MPAWREGLELVARFIRVANEAHLDGVSKHLGTLGGVEFDQRVKHSLCSDKYVVSNHFWKSLRERLVPLVEYTACTRVCAHACDRLHNHLKLPRFVAFSHLLLYLLHHQSSGLLCVATTPRLSTYMRMHVHLLVSEGKTGPLSMISKIMVHLGLFSKRNNIFRTRKYS
jgi:hypothetical protein